jgi:hypothetical protein
MIKEEMMKRSARTAASTLRRHLAALAVITAGMACSGEPSELPLVPCGVEERSIGGTLRRYVELDYDEQGNLVSREERDVATGAASVRHSWQYRPDGKLVLATEADREGPVREAALQYAAYAYDRVASVTWRAYDDEGRVDYEYLDGAQRVIERWDRDDDGTAEDTREYSYDPDGNLQSFTVRCDGEVDPREITTLSWDRDGRIVRIETHRNGELTGLTEYFYNEDGLRDRVEYSGTGTVTAYTETYELDADGNVRQREYEAILDTPDILSSENSAEYDPEGRILNEVFAPDSVPVQRNIYLYDCPGHEDSSGRRLGTPEPAAPPPPQGPLGSVGTDAIRVYTYNDYRCSESSASALSRL